MNKEKKLLPYEQVKLEQIFAGMKVPGGCVNGESNAGPDGCVNGDSNTGSGGCVDGSSNAGICQ